MKLTPLSRAVNRLTLVVVVLLATTLLAQQLQPAKGSSEIARLVCAMVERDHISHHRIDDEISTRLVDKFLKEFDPQKVYFYQADVDEAHRWNTSLDDQLKTGNIDFAFQTFATFMKRLEERVNYAQKLIDQPQDFTVQESMPIDGKDQPWAKSADDLNERWRKRIKFELLSLKLEQEAAAEKKKDPNAKPSKKDPTDDANQDPKTRLHKRYRSVLRNFRQMESDDVLELYLTALANCFDPHSSYMSPTTLKDFQITMQLSLEGIGAALKSDDGNTIVASLVPTGAAAKDGRLKVGDKIVGVGQETGEIVDVVEMKLRYVVSMIRGKQNTKVRLKVMSPGSPESKIIELVRQKVELEESAVKGEIIDVSTRLKGAKGRIGVINIPSFYRDFNGASSGQDDFKSTARDVKAVLRDFDKKGGVNGIIIDLRTNGGGALSEAIDVSGLFIPNGPVVQVKDQRQDPRSLADEDEEIDYTGPLVVVCNRLSASASEIFAGVIKDYKRGLIVGDVTTHGKGTVQNVNNVGPRML
ncbi:MAG: S41 family peptidase, partial [Planctomycetales bacterium]